MRYKHQWQRKGLVWKYSTQQAVYLCVKRSYVHLYCYFQVQIIHYQGVLCLDILFTREIDRVGLGLIQYAAPREDQGIVPLGKGGLRQGVADFRTSI